VIREGAGVTDTVRNGEDSVAASSRRDEPALCIVYSPDSQQVGRRWVLDRVQTVFIGRNTEGGLSVSDERMSKLHLLIAATGSELTCADAGSTNGTFVNGLATGSVTLRHGDVLRAGDTLFVVSQGDWMAHTRESAMLAAKTTFPILLQGETGTGKELLARMIHEASGRTGPFIPLNCATLSRELAAAELFGHIRGAFSGALNARPGLFRAGSGGTLFLDEIGDLPLEIQPAFLRALEERKVRPVGGDHEQSVDVRLLAATNADLEGAAKNGTFRADLLARLAHVVLRLPPLRERRTDILTLAQEFAPRVRFSPNAAEALLLWNWPRNVRELRAAVEVASLLGPERTVALRDLRDRLPDAAERVKARRPDSSGNGAGATEVRQLADRHHQLRTLLEAHRGNVSKVADELGKPRAQVYRWVKALGLDVDEFRKG
jgi:DNA-binding NtrC family response regulator